MVQINMSETNHTNVLSIKCGIVKKDPNLYIITEGNSASQENHIFFMAKEILCRIIMTY